MSDPERIAPALRRMAGRNLLDLDIDQDEAVAVLLAALGHAFAIGDLIEGNPADGELILTIMGIQPR